MCKDDSDGDPLARSGPSVPADAAFQGSWREPGGLWLWLVRFPAALALAMAVCDHPEGAGRHRNGPRPAPPYHWFGWISALTRLTGALPMCSNNDDIKNDSPFRSRRLDPDHPGGWPMAACSGDDSDDSAGHRPPRLPGDPAETDTGSGGMPRPLRVRSRGTLGPWTFRGLLERLTRRPSPA